MPPPPKSPPKTLTFRIDAKTRKALQIEAGVRHCSEAALVLLFVEEGLGRAPTHKRLTDLETRMEVVERLTGLEEGGQDSATKNEPPNEPKGN